MPSQLDAYHVGPNKFEYKNSNGFMITIDMNSKDFEQTATGGSN